MRDPIRLDLAAVRHPWERFTFASSIAANAALVAAAVAAVYIGPEWLTAYGRVSDLVNRIRLGAAIAIVLLPALWLLRFGRWAAFRENAVHVSREQLPELQAILERHCRALGMEPPALYLSTLVKSGVATALALTRSRRVIVLGPELFAGLNQLRDRADVLEFVLGQELARLALGHASWWEDLILGYLKRVPLLRLPLLSVQALSRDRLAMVLAPEGFRGLVFAAVGGDLLDHVDAAQLVRQILDDDTPRSWTWLGNRELDGPHFAKRVRHLYRAGFLHLERILESGAGAPRARGDADDREPRPSPTTH